MHPLAPLQSSFTADEIESDLNRMVVDLFDRYFADTVADNHVLGMAHRGSMDLIRQFIQFDGLALPNREGMEDAYRYLYRAWIGRNAAGRGFHFLETVLQLIWPNAWSLGQLWHQGGKTYPTALVAAEEPDAWLTSRVQITIASESETGATLAALAPVLRSILAARLVPRFAVGGIGGSTLRFAVIGQGANVHRTDGAMIYVALNAISIELPIGGYVLDDAGAPIEV